LEKNGTPNIAIEGIPFFVEVDNDFILDVEWQLYEDKWREEAAFQFWLVLVGFGGTRYDGTCPVEMKEGHLVEELKEFYEYTYEVCRDKNDVRISVISKKDREEVAVVFGNR